MNDGPPSGQFPEDRGVPAQRGSGGGQRRDAPQFNAGAEIKAFYKMLDDSVFLRSLEGMLPDTITAQAFVRTAKTAVQSKPELLNPAWRASLMQSICKAAAQGLLPDGKHGALIPRQDQQAGGVYQVCWQPMVWGITMLGRRAGALKKINCGFVFEGEKYRLKGGIEDTIEHEIDPLIVDKVYQEGTDLSKFLPHLVLAYAIITAPDGTVTWRYMTKSRIARLRAASKASKGPWSGPFFDEMILKGVILYTSKHIDLSGETPEMVRFKTALEHDMEIDTDDDDAPARVTSGSGVAALPAPNAMDRLNQQLTGQMTDTVMGNGEQEKVVTVTPPQTSEQKPQQQPQPDQAAQEQQREQTEQRQQDNATATQQTQTKANTGEEQAKAFATQMKKDIWEVASLTTDGESALATLCTTDKNARGMGRLRVSYRKTYDWMLVSFLQPGVIEKIGALQTKSPVLYDDIIAANQKQAA